MDIDGVLNTKSSWRTPFQLNDSCIHEFCAYLQGLKCDVQIILTSSWKSGYSSLPENETPQLKSLRSKLAKYGFTLSGRTKSLQNRSRKIEDYLANHYVSDYAIIDEDAGEYPQAYLSKVSLIDSETGFTKAQRKKIIWNHHK